MERLLSVFVAKKQMQSKEIQIKRHGTDTKSVCIQ